MTIILASHFPLFKKIALNYPARHLPCLLWFNEDGIIVKIRKQLWTLSLDPDPNHLSSSVDCAAGSSHLVRKYDLDRM